MQGAQPVSQSDEGGTKRFRAKRDAIPAAAAETINTQSAKGMTSDDVARRVGLNTTSVTYYFKRKDDHAADSLELTLDTPVAMLDEGQTGTTTERHVTSYHASHQVGITSHRAEVCANEYI